MKQTQNQYYGKAIDLPILPKGSIYLATDTGALYVYGDNKVPNNVSTAEAGASIEWTQVTGKPALFDGEYDSLDNKPDLFDFEYVSLLNKPTLFSGDYNDLVNVPATSGSSPEYDRVLVDRVETGTAGPQYAIKGINNSDLSGAYNIGLYGQSDHTGSNTGNFNYGAFNKGRYSGTNGTAGGVYGAFNEAEYRGSDPSGNNSANTIVYATHSMADVTSAAAGTIPYIIGHKCDVQQLSSNVIAGEVWGQFTKLKLDAGTTTGAVAVQELVYEGTGTIGGTTMSILKISAGDTPVMATGTARAIDCQSGLASRFYGRMNFDVLTADGHDSAAMSKIEGTKSTNDLMRGLKAIARQKGTGGATGGVYGATFEAEQLGSGTVDYLTGTVNRVAAKGNATSQIDYIRGTDIQATCNSATTSVTQIQGQHTTVALTAGNITDIQVQVLDADISGGTISGNFAYLRMMNDTVTTGGYARSIDSQSVLPSVFAGSMQAAGYNDSAVTEHTNNAAAVSAGLAVGTHYRTGDALKIVH